MSSFSVESKAKFLEVDEKNESSLEELLKENPETRGILIVCESEPTGVATWDGLRDAGALSRSARDLSKTKIVVNAKQLQDGEAVITDYEVLLPETYTLGRLHGKPPVPGRLVNLPPDVGSSHGGPPPPPGGDNPDRIYRCTAIPWHIIPFKHGQQGLTYPKEVICPYKHTFRGVVYMQEDYVRPEGPT